MKYFIAIPTYKRSVSIQKDTLSLLHNVNKKYIKLFVNDNDPEINDYIELGYPVVKMNNIKGSKDARNYIFKYFKEGQLVVSLSDDISEFMKYENGKFKTIKDVDKMFNYFFDTMLDKDKVAWGISPHTNKFFIKGLSDFNTNLSFLIGDCFGFINSHKYFLHSPVKDDYEFSIQSFENGGTIRFNKYAMKVKHLTNPGGANAYRNKKLEDKSVKELLDRYGEYIARVKQKPNGWTSIIFKRIEEPIDIEVVGTVKDKASANAILAHLKEEPLNWNTSRERLGEGQTQAFGYINDRRGNFHLSKYTNNDPELWKLIKTFAKKNIPKWKFTTVQVNQNFYAKKHIDGNNVGTSVIVALGDYTGGDLIVEGDHFNIKNKFLKFNGSVLAHEVNKVKKGNRVSLVFFQLEPQKTHKRPKDKKINWTECDKCGAVLQSGNIGRHKRQMHNIGKMQDFNF